MMGARVGAGVGSGVGKHGGSESVAALLAIATAKRAIATCLRKRAIAFGRVKHNFSGFLQF